MNSEVKLLYHEDPGSSELNVTKIVQFLGGAVKPVRLTREALAHEEPLKSMVQVGGCLITSAPTLLKVRDQLRSGSDLRPLLMGSALNVLVYGFEPTAGHSQVLRELTSGGLSAVESLPCGASEFRVAQNFRHICRQFTGLSLGMADPGRHFTFVEEPGQGHCASLIRIGHRPFFACTEDQGSQLMLLAGRQVADLDAAVPNDASILEFFPDLAPLMMFLFSASRNGLWHNDAPNACFIIDDPLLKERYGFLEYPKLLEVMEAKGFCTSIAFIPWNYRRSNRSVTELFASYPHRYSLCVHGCDHTAGEFGGTDRPLLRAKAQKALDRMMAHRQLSRLPFDEVMVFPQGVFSTTAIEALKSCGYLAAVNSTVHPIDSGEALTLRELLEVAVTRFSNFPVFIRRYPKKLAELAFDLFLGKPVLVVEHHGYFRCGYDALTEIVEKLNGFDERLEWTTLANTCSQACLRRTAENGNIHVWFFTDRFRLQNNTGKPQCYVLCRRRLPEAPLLGVTINGLHADYVEEENFLRMHLSLDVGQLAEVGIQYSKIDPVALTLERDRVRNVKVFVRRYLSECRDNYVDRNWFLSRMYSTARRLSGRKN